MFTGQWNSKANSFRLLLLFLLISKQGSECFCIFPAALGFDIAEGDIYMVAGRHGRTK
jgi:hypothetical protein